MFSPDAVKKIEARMKSVKPKGEMYQNHMSFDSGCDDSDNKTISDSEETISDCEADTESLLNEPRWRSKSTQNLKAEPKLRYSNTSDLIESEVSLNSINASTQTLDCNTEPRWRKSDLNGMSELSLNSIQSTREYRILPPFVSKRRRATLHNIHQE